MCHHIDRCVSVRNYYHNDVLFAQPKWTSSFLSLFSLGLALAKYAVEPQAGKHQDDADPLPGRHRVAEDDDGAEDGEELPSGGDDGTGQGTKGRHRHEDKMLGMESRGTVWY